MHRVIAERRDIRRFRPDPPAGRGARPPAAGRPPRPVRRADAALAADRDPGHRDPALDPQPRPRERLRQAERFDDRARSFLDQKIEGIVEAPLGICVCCDHGDDRRRGARPGHDPARPTSTAPPARSRTCGSPRAPRGSASAGSASTGRTTCGASLGIPDAADPIAYLCVGWPDERPVRPGLETAGWSARLPLDAVVMRERWHGREGGDAPVAAATGPDRWRGRRRTRPARPARQAGRQPRRARAAHRALGGDHRRPARRRGSARECSSAPPTTDTSATERASSATDVSRRWPPRRPAARPRSACSPATAVTRCSSPTSGSPDRPRPACADRKVAAGTADMTSPRAERERARRGRARGRGRTRRRARRRGRRLPRARRDRDREHHDLGGARVAR